MQRWQLTTGLFGLAALAALVVPQLKGGTSTPSTPVEPQPVPPVAELSTAVQGALKLEAGLDHPAVLAGKVEERLMVMTLTAPEDPNAISRPVNVAVVMDRSGSMAGKNKMTYARDAAAALLTELNEQDRFAFVTFSDRAELVVPSTPVVDQAGLTRTVRSVSEGGGTNIYDGLQLGLEQVRANASDASVNRVILLSDGIANISVTEPEALAAAAARFSAEGITVSTMGLGLDFNEDLLTAMSDRAGGTYRFVDDPASLSAYFQDELNQLSTVAASGVSLEVDLEGAQLVEVFGYQAEPTSDGFRIWMGDVYAGQTRKVVARVRVPATASGQSVTVAKVRVGEIGKNADYTPIAVNATGTEDVQVVERTVNMPMAVAARSAESGALADKAARAYAEGKKDESIALAKASNLVAGEAASRYAAPELAAQAASVKVQEQNYSAFDNESEEGRREVKKNKEASRAWYH